MKKRITTFGEGRELICETIQALKSGEMDVGRGMAIAANMKVLNDNIFAEVAVAKMSIVATGVGKEFGEVMRLGTRKMFDGQLIDQKSIEE